ncbi:MAG: sigma-70 family RNA polymerase sigma factor [Clostridia bacterium]|nr:sigma-70 family RNA polymerase sigma factor [Clostridia bacterium]
MEELQAFALSPAGMAQAEAFLSRNAAIENHLMLSHARMDRLREQKKLLEKDGGNHPEKQQLLQKMHRMEKEILRDLQRLLSTEAEIANTVRSLPDENLRTVLEMRYLHHVQYYAIAEKMHMDERHVYRLRKKALQQAAMILAMAGKITAGQDAGN